jgi:hypothetical protein
MTPQFFIALAYYSSAIGALIQAIEAMDERVAKLEREAREYGDAAKG